MTVAFLKGFSKQSWALVVTVASIFLLGLVMVYNTSSAEILDRSLSTSVTVALTRQALYCLIGVAAALFVYRLGYQFLLRNSRPLFWLGIFLLLLVFIPGVGRIKNGAHRWIGLSSFTFQPSELIKYLLPIVYIETIRKNKEALNSFFAFAKMSGSLGIAILLVMIEPDNGSAAVMSLALIPLFFLSGVKLRYWALPWSYKPEHTALGRRVRWVGKEAYFRLLAFARLYLDNFDHIGASWFGEGKQVGMEALHYGADDFGGTIIEENVHRATGWINKADENDMVQMIRQAGFTPVQRNTFYDIVKTYEGIDQVEVPQWGRRQESDQLPEAAVAANSTS